MGTLSSYDRGGNNRKILPSRRKSFRNRSTCPLLFFDCPWLVKIGKISCGFLWKTGQKSGISTPALSPLLLTHTTWWFVFGVRCGSSSSRFPRWSYRRTLPLTLVHRAVYVAQRTGWLWTLLVCPHPAAAVAAARSSSSSRIPHSSSNKHWWMHTCYSSRYALLCLCLPLTLAVLCLFPVHNREPCHAIQARNIYGIITREGFMMYNTRNTSHTILNKSYLSINCC